MIYLFVVLGKVSQLLVVETLNFCDILQLLFCYNSLVLGWVFIPLPFLAPHRATYNLCYTYNIHLHGELWNSWCSCFCAWSHLPCIPQLSSSFDRLRGPHFFARWHCKPKATSHVRKPPFVHTPPSLERCSIMIKGLNIPSHCSRLIRLVQAQK